MKYEFSSTREYEPQDIPALKLLWTEVFGDSEELVDSFFEHLRGMGTGFVAERRGEVIGMAFLLFAELWSKDLRKKEKVSYIYAVAVKPEWRRNGVGEALTKECLRYSRSKDVDICCTLPACEKLYEWYEKVGQFKTELNCSFETVYASDKDIDIKELYADEYGWLRDDLLFGKPYVHFYYSYLLFNEAICKSCGGGLFAYKNGIVCGYPEGDTLYIKEAINDAPEFIPSLCRKLGMSKAVIRRDAIDDEPFICSSSPLPYGTVWNLTLD